MNVQMITAEIIQWFTSLYLAGFTKLYSLVRLEVFKGKVP